MFIYSIRASTIRFFSVIALSIVALILLLVFGGARQTVSASSTSVDFSGIKTNEDRVEFIVSLGVKVKPDAVESESFRVPENFDRMITGYNEIQKMQGLDLSKYKNKKVTRYTYEAENYNGSGESVFVNLIIYKSTVIACDVSSQSPDGFIEPLVKFS
ncbi:MAG: DUF4830 domain-containing protein [Clostridia bacterium]|nr:DUF4830 domain-containing protein [Clostridia bacterium]